MIRLSREFKVERISDADACRRGASGVSGVSGDVAKSRQAVRLLSCASSLKHAGGFPGVRVSPYLSSGALPNRIALVWPLTREAAALSEPRSFALGRPVRARAGEAGFPGVCYPRRRERRLVGRPWD